MKESEALKISIIQTGLHWEDTEKNINMFSAKISEIPGETDIIVLPEMFNTGFSMQAALLAEEMNGPTMRWMAEQAAKKQAVITGSMMIREEGQYYNRLIWMQPDGASVFYDKHHLFGLGSEHETFTAGNQQMLIPYKGWKIFPVVCYDIRFPVWLRNTMSYDLLLVVASWPERRIAHWDMLLKARALENQCYVAACNRTGADGQGIDHPGHSVFIDPAGEVLHTLEGEETASLSFHKAQLKKTRRLYPFLRDRDHFHLE